MIITIYNKQKDLSLTSLKLKRSLPFLLEKLHIQTDEVILHFVSKRQIGIIHQEFFSDPSPTDCMSFPIDSPQNKSHQEGFHHILGEIFVCPKVALEYAQKNKTDPYKETLLYVIHGLLHLIGYDDLDTGSRRKMRLMEKKCLQLLDSYHYPSEKNDCIKSHTKVLIKTTKQTTS